MVENHSLVLLSYVSAVKSISEGRSCCRAADSVHIGDNAQRMLELGADLLNHNSCTHRNHDSAGLEVPFEALADSRQLAREGSDDDNVRVGHILGLERAA
eukprot:GILJ01037760.1.p1 GENE.GILJ01037760.1~~GILJ01037760.1.p1  ORF type:complete len:100 (-),score=10.11 GILJ01037760.1:27-326(-)